MPTYRKIRSESISSTSDQTNETTYQNQVIQPEVENEPTMRVREKPKKRFSFGKLISAFLIILSIGFFAGGAYFIMEVLSSPIDDVFVRDDGCKGILCGLQDTLSLLPTQSKKIKGQDEGRTNFLILGVDSSANLADTIMIASLYHKQKKIVTVNIPRDFYVLNKYTGGYTKINELYTTADAASNAPGAGARGMVDFLSKEFGIPIHYWVVADFQGVEKGVDVLGGIDVNVEKAFTDCNFPTRNYSGYMPCQVFKAGPQKMNGERALIYARSRKGNNGEGTDFARSRRQSIVIQSALAKAKSKNLLDNINNINSYLNVLGENVMTNLTDVGEISSLYNLGKSMDAQNDYLKTIWDDGNGILCTGPNPQINYHILYCGGAIPGTNGSSAGKTKARNFIQNLLVMGQSSELFGTKTVIVGNLSNDTNKIYQDFLNAGFKNVSINNTYPSIGPATATSIEQAVIYIPEAKLRQAFEELKLDTSVQYTIKSQIPAGLPVPPRSQDAKILVWVESV